MPTTTLGAPLAAGPTTVPGPALCPEFSSGGVPSDLGSKERASTSGGRDGGVRVTYSNPSGSRVVTFLSGVPAEVGAGMTLVAERVRARGVEATVSMAGETRMVYWAEGPANEYCSSFAVVTTGLSDQELREVVNQLG
ncbi:MAG: hypothetical protein ACRDHY_19210 [Anaerolineales bacterium]